MFYTWVQFVLYFKQICLQFISHIFNSSHVLICAICSTHGSNVCFILSKYACNSSTTFSILAMRREKRSIPELSLLTRGEQGVKEWWETKEKHIFLPSHLSRAIYNLSLLKIRTDPLFRCQPLNVAALKLLLKLLTSLVLAAQVRDLRW